MLDSHISLRGNYKVAVHCAIDFFLPNKILWWKLGSIQRAWANVPVKNIYNVGLLPGLGNIIFDDQQLPVNFHYAQYYTRIFEGVHRDRSNLFSKPTIVKIIIQRYRESMEGVTPTRATSQEQFLARGGIEKFLTNMVKVASADAEARVEMVFSSSTRYTKLSQAVQEAFNAFQNLTSNDDRFSLQLLHAMDPAWFSERLSNWIPYFVNSTQRLLGKF